MIIDAVASERAMPWRRLGGLLFAVVGLLSQALVPFTIEFDNEFGRQMQHRTTDHNWTAGSRRGPWLTYW